jgi:hypothetical protein
MSNLPIFSCTRRSLFASFPPSFVAIPTLSVGLEWGDINVLYTTDVHGKMILTSSTTSFQTHAFVFVFVFGFGFGFGFVYVFVFVFVFVLPLSCFVLSCLCLCLFMVKSATNLCVCS